MYFRDLYNLTTSDDDTNQIKAQWKQIHLRNGTDNAPGTGLFSDEFPFWKLANGKTGQKHTQKETFKNTENFVNETSNANFYSLLSLPFFIYCE